MSEAGATRGLGQAILEVLLQTLLPGNGTWPSASELGLAHAVRERVGMAEGHEEALLRVLGALPEGFDASSQAEREETLHPLAGSDDFGALLLVAYDAYYVQPGVLLLLEERCGYVTRPPQPDGFELAPFDESVLARARGREPFWREA